MKIKSSEVPWHLLLFILTTILHQKPTIQFIIYYTVWCLMSEKWKKLLQTLTFQTSMAVPCQGIRELVLSSSIHPTTCILKIVKINISDNFQNTRDNVSLSTFWWCPEPPLVSRRQWYSPVYRAQLSKYTFVKSVFYRKIFLQNLFLLAGLRTSCSSVVVGSISSPSFSISMRYLGKF